MAFSRRLGVVSILGACWFAAVGCGDDEDRKTSSEDGGEGGEAAGSSGKSGGGDTNNAGKGGLGGSGGNAGANTGGVGESGSGVGGDGGGVPGMAGAGGETPGSAGEGGVSSGGAASGGAGGEGGSPAPQLTSCAYECTPGTPCQTVDGTVPCDAATSRCVVSEQVCVVKDDCAPFANLFWIPCETTAGCLPDGSEVCIDWQGKGVGYCALVDVDGCLAGVSTTVAELGGNGNVDVCVEQGVCKEGECDFACNHDFAAPCAESGNGDMCNPASGLCECGAPAECESNVCLNSLCAECDSADDCPGAQFGLDECVDGKCGCTGADVCPTPFTNAPAVCE